ncbi:MAG TPA: hypothetical protein VFM40_05740, partial [Actinomycetota bacterium]|nr:hypothetical protein [Actinomycetota bacterium]
MPARAVTAVDPRSGKLSDAVGGMYVETFDDAIRPEIGAGAGGVWLIDALTVSFIDPAAASVREATGLGAVGG